MRVCETYRGDLAASLYEELSSEARARLDEHLGQCPACRDEAQALRAFVARIPKTAPEFLGDLRPALMAELERQPRARRWNVRYLWVPLAACFALFVLAYFSNPQPQDGTAPIATENPRVPPRSVGTVTIADAARTLAAARNFVAARELLTDALGKRLPDSGLLQLALADIEFEHGQRYAAADAAYETLRKEYPEVWESSPAETKDRFDLLVESREDAYAPLYDLDKADSFAGLEQVLAHYPARPLVAERAFARMAEVVGAEAGTDAQLRVAALEAVKARCTEPLAVAQLSIALADVYWKDLKDPVRARPLYESAVGTEHLVLAQRARKALAELDALPRP